MQIYKIYPRGFGANSYILTEDGENAIVIDPAQKGIENKLKELGLTAKFVLLTHSHFDHVGGVAGLQKLGAKVLCSQQEKPLFNTPADLFERFGAPREPFEIDDTFSHGEEKNLCSIPVKALITPGHTAGSCCYEIIEKDGGRYLFTGDTLFENSIGRTDFPTGNIGKMRESLRFLYTLNDDYILHSGHGEETTLERERKYNPFLIDAL